MTAARPRAGDEGGFTLVEMLMVMFMLSLIVGGIVTLYVSGVRAQAGLTSGFQAQTSLHVGVDRLRKDVNLACSETAQSASSITLSDPPCDGSNNVTWCTSGSGSQYALYRVPGSTCTISSGVKLSDYITSGSIFTYVAQNTPSGSNSLPHVHLDFYVNATPANNQYSYHEVDDLMFLNGART